MVNTDDFRFMFRGKQLKELSDSTMVAPIILEGNLKRHALLMLHGFSSSPAVFRYLLPLLPKYDGIYCPILPGHGQSIEAFSKVTGQDWLSAATQQAMSLSKTYEKVDVLGLSLGGLLACQLPSVIKLNHLFLLAPALNLRVNIPLALGLSAILSALGFISIRNQAGNILQDKYQELAYRRVPISAIQSILTMIEHLKFKQPTCQTDLFLGRNDDVVNCKRVAARFTDISNTSIHWLENSAHVLPLDGDLEAIADIIKQRFTVTAK